MLDLSKLAQEIPHIGNQMRKDAVAGQQRMELAMSLFEEVKSNQEHFVETQSQWQEQIIFNAATPIEPIETCIDILPIASKHSVFSTDGSQIAPSHHEIAYCYLINIGRIMLHYRQNLHPLLDTLPEIYYKSEDLYVSRQWGIRTDEWMSYRRTVAEAEVLAQMACKWVNPPGAHFDIPNLAITDGSLIYWFLDTIAIEAREQILDPILHSWEQLQESNIPVIGYISSSRSIEALSFLRLPACTFEHPNCFVSCGENFDNAPCQKILPLKDVSLWSQILQPGQRSAIFRSNSRILDLYSEKQHIYFCYLHVGTEIARIEFPEWVAEDETLLYQSLSIILTQVEKGFGYPVALAEAHNLAVVKGSDRSRFFALLEEQMIKAGLKNVGVSYKEARKRGSIA